jgi:aspartate aminotransferase
MAALHVAMRICGEPGDEIVIPTPCWLDYPLYARVLGLVPVAVPLEAGAFDLDPQVIARALTPRTCAVLLANPSNPTGRAYDAERFSALAAVLGGAARRSGRPITLIADEAHRDFVPADRFVPAERHWPATLVIYSFGKYHLLQGQRIGYLAVAPGHPHRDTARREAVRSVRALGFCTPTALMQAAVPALLGLRHDLAEVDTWRTRFMAELRGAGYRVAPADGTLFLYVEAPGGDDLAFARVLAARGLLVLPAAVFHHRGWFRVSLTGDARMLEGALRVLREARAA